MAGDSPFVTMGATMPENFVRRRHGHLRPGSRCVSRRLDLEAGRDAAALEAPMEPTRFWEQPWSATVIRCLRAANPPEHHQRRTAERLKAAWHELDTGHYPMLSEPEALTRLLSA